MTTNTQYGPEPEPASAPPDPDAERAPDPVVPGGWSALVYGRTFQVDQWWRALPAGVDRQGPVADAVRAAVAGGIRLEAGPRFLLHRDLCGVLVGAACELGRISRTMVHDRFGRPLYGFVGWYRAAAPGDAGGRITELAELERHLAEWAGPVYAEWITPTWEAVGRAEAEPRTTRPVAAPWQGEAGAAPAGAVWLPAQSAGTHLLPGSDAAALWSAAAGSRDRCLLATGWRRRSDADAHRFTHLTSEDCRAYELLRPPPPPPPPAPPRPASVAGPGPAAGPTGPGGKAGGTGGTGRTGGAPEPEPSFGETFRAGRRVFRRVTRGLFGAEEPGEAGPPTSPGPSEPPGAGGWRYGDDPAAGRRYYGDLDQPSTGPTRPPARPEQSDGAHPASTGSASIDPRPAGPAGPGRRAEGPLYRRTRAVDAQQADLSGMFGEFDEPEPPPPTAPHATPSDPRKSGSEAPGPRPADDSSTGEPS
ncbi:hypothetical protein [Kitasatospora purpeofusca]|uniref:hypothetical protein n=1 Tax=Kitasatospora purpeofusca TaxID=67352 RepID=UPI00225503EE|nr:hypothetical protein [Kitasatospora purpeofusca]MCX4755647.1 hypothetical protein [Kitasatospora purpeofusca]WSR36490.1 hypothetical protein OG715_39370 [Kitasatospora purpeofusca]